MYKQIRELLKENEGKKFDNDFIFDAFNIMVQHDRPIMQYARTLTVGGERANVLASYNRERRIITVNKNEIIKHSKDDYSMRLNTLNSLRHELEHAYTLKKLYQFKHDIESEVTILSNIDYIISEKLPIAVQLDNVEYDDLVDGKENEANYLVAPDERIASIRAARFMRNLLMYKKDSPELKIAKDQLFMGYMRGYLDNGFYLDPPTYTYLLNLRLLSEYKKIKYLADNSNYSLETRATFGLPISYDEVKGISKMLKLDK